MSNRRHFLRSAAAGAATLAVGSSILTAGQLSARADDSVPHSKPESAPKKIIALEEHFMLPEFVTYLAETKQNIKPALFNNVVPVLSDFGAGRLEVMDKNGIDFAVLSLSGPGVQIEPDREQAVKLARYANDRLAKEMHNNPHRYGGFAHLAMQDPREAARELERCVRQLKMQGAMINGETNGLYLDDRRYDIFWEKVQELDVPVYLHPGNPPDHPHMFTDHPEMWGPVWSWAVETCSHAMRLIFSGTFDRFPGAKIILGHMGETLPIQLWRLDSRIQTANLKYALKAMPSYYVRKNIFITTSGVCCDAALRCALDSIGPENVMFSVDYPFEKTDIASRWIRSASVSEAERNAVAWQNASRLMKL
ncbi:amidohydrolase family protein [Erwinia sp. HDF1-3R]|uniref:amidohydrolase family protein n=1 Tax=Erwinia sp. HDF1-3R TaxID=3141543 RepID=UPI0031F59705